MTIERFVFEPNGEDVFKVTTDSGTIGYIAASIPIEAIENWIRRLDADWKRRIGRIRYHNRHAERRQFRPVRVRVRRRLRAKVYRGPRRFYKGAARR
jgi:predicted aminopeptidase